MVYGHLFKIVDAEWEATALVCHAFDKEATVIVTYWRYVPTAVKVLGILYPNSCMLSTVI